MKNLMISLLMFVALAMSLHALDTGQMDTATSKSINIANYATVSQNEYAADIKLNIWHKDTLMYVGDNRLDTGINLNKAVTSTTLLSTSCSKGGSAVGARGV